MKVGVIGGGAWGTALANVLAGKGADVLLWAREEEVVRTVNLQNENRHFLPGIQLHKSLKATGSLQETCLQKDLLISAVPAQFVRPILESMRPYWPLETPVVSVSKGIENRTLKLLKDVFEDVLPGSVDRQLAFLSGPNFAREVAQGMPAASTLASRNEDLAQRVQAMISVPFFKLYLSSDIIGVEVGGSVKNVVAIAAGIVEGLGLGKSAMASIMTRGLHEMTRLGVALGANPLTFLGFAGLGDLILTCTGELSRNRTMGLELASGRRASEILQGKVVVTEGVATAESVHHLAQKLLLELPICEAVYQILFHERDCTDVVREIAGRGLKEELEGLI